MDQSTGCRRQDTSRAEAAHACLLQVALRIEFVTAWPSKSTVCSKSDNFLDAAVAQTVLNRCSHLSAAGDEMLCGKLSGCDVDTTPSVHAGASSGALRYDFCYWMRIDVMDELGTTPRSTSS